MSLVTSIQKYSIHDGDGIRTTIFFKGCHLRCQWCHNPETQQYGPQLSVDAEKCTGCQACEKVCPAGAISLVGTKTVTDMHKCRVCGTCVDECLLNLREVIGREYTVKALMEEIKKDEMFYEQSGGGVTLSGGEVMTMDMDYLEELVKRCDREGISVTIDTCGQAPYENYERLLKYVKNFLYDIKIMDPAVHKAYMGQGNELILDNLKKLSAAGATLYIRIPTVKGVNGDDASMAAIIDFLVDNHIQVAQVNLLPYHNIGAGKYAKLGLTYEGGALSAPTGEEMQHFVAMFVDNGFHNTRIGG